MKHILKLYITIIAKEVKRFATYRTNIYAGIMAALFMLGARYALWLALFATGNAGDSSLEETMTYFVVVDIVMIWLAATYSNSIGTDIQTGDLAGKIIRPFSYHFQLVTEFHAKAVADTLTRSIPVFIVALIFIGLLPPVSLGAFAVFIISALLGGVIFSLVDLIVSYSVFWLIDFWYVSWFKNALFMIFGGVTLPLWFYPNWLLAICNVLPFQYAIFKPMQIYLGRVSHAEIISVIAMQLLWIVILFGLERLVWKRAQYKLIVQGG
jgi:ABC-2 type transport system permease protein